MALHATGSSAEIMSVQRAGTTVARTQAQKNADTRNILDFIHASEHNNILGGNYASQDSDKIVAGFLDALDDGPFEIPSGALMLRDPVELPTAAHFWGQGQQKTKIYSDIPGDTLLKVSSTAAFLDLSHFSLIGNGSSDASLGSGHAIGWIDPPGGAWSPQQAKLHSIDIQDFLGRDLRANDSSDVIHSAAIAIYGGLQCVINKIYFYNVGHGIYLDQVQNCKIIDCGGEQAYKYGLFVYGSENVICDMTTLVACGDGTTDAGYLSGAPADLRSGAILSCKNQGFRFDRGKVKTTLGAPALINSLFSAGDQFEGNWLRGDTRSVDSPHKVFYVERSPGIGISKNIFAGAATAYAATRKWQNVEIYHSQTNELMSARIVGNLFEDVSGHDTEYHIKIGGNSSVRKVKAVIEDNVFGSREGRSSATTIDTDILLSSVKLVSSRIGSNTHLASTNVTRSACVTASSITHLESTFGPLESSANGGTITAEYSGLRDTEIHATLTYNPSSIADGARLTTAFTLTGVEFTDKISVTASVDTKGVKCWARKTTTDTCELVFENDTGSAQDIDSGVFYITAIAWKGG